MGTLTARVLSADCTECRDQLVADCREHGLPLPTDEVIVVPEGWANHRCPHPDHSFELDFRSGANNSVVSDDEVSTESMRCRGDFEIEAPEWWNNLDATKDIGYPVREEGRYGSHPAHDGFDDESDP